jgi:hypothetical protein
VVQKVSKYEGGAFNPLSAIMGMMNPLSMLGSLSGIGNGKRKRQAKGAGVVQKVSDYEGGGVVEKVSDYQGGAGLTGLFDWLGPLNMLGLGKKPKKKREPTARGLKVAELMRKEGLTLGQASKKIKQMGAGKRAIM